MTVWATFKIFASYFMQKYFKDVQVFVGQDGWNPHCISCQKKLGWHSVKIYKAKQYRENAVWCSECNFNEFSGNECSAAQQQDWRLQQVAEYLRRMHCMEGNCRRLQCIAKYCRNCSEFQNTLEHYSALQNSVED